MGTGAGCSDPCARQDLHDECQGISSADAGCFDAVCWRPRPCQPYLWGHAAPAGLSRLRGPRDRADGESRVPSAFEMFAPGCLVTLGEGSRSHTVRTGAPVVQQVLTIAPQVGRPAKIRLHPILRYTLSRGQHQLLSRQAPDCRHRHLLPLGPRGPGPGPRAPVLLRSDLFVPVQGRHRCGKRGRAGRLRLDPQPPGCFRSATAPSWPSPRPAALWHPSGDRSDGSQPRRHGLLPAQSLPSTLVIAQSHLPSVAGGGLTRVDGRTVLTSRSEGRSGT